MQRPGPPEASRRGGGSDGGSRGPSLPCGGAGRRQGGSGT